MEYVVCTLFESNYHYGVAVLSNSLYKMGFRGSIYAGFRGPLPPWASTAKENTVFDWNGSLLLEAGDGLNIYFLPLDTDYHLTNYKPDFMLRILSLWEFKLKGILYFDPDIVVSAPWSYFKEWLSCGIALCEDVNSPLSEFHPRRVAWRRYFSNFALTLIHKNAIYVNGGFVGIEIQHMQFLTDWKKVQELMAQKIGGLNRSSLIGSEKLHETHSGNFAPFSKTDQDALNATVELHSANYSLIGQEGMAFVIGAAIMHHALGQPKPWNFEPLAQIINGKYPRSVEKIYWENADYLIKAHSKYEIFKMKLLISFAAFIGRFYSRN